MLNAEPKIKSYAFFDVIGIKKALLNGTCLNILDKVWKSVDNWAAHKSSMQVFLEKNKKTQTTSEANVFIISDSIFLSTKEEYTLESFYDIVDSLRGCLIKNDIKFYTIINRDEEISPHSFPPTGARMNNYYTITGSGAAWGNIYLADENLKFKEDWKLKYNYYVIGDKNLIDKYPICDSHEFQGMNNEHVKIFSIK